MSIRNSLRFGLLAATLTAAACAPVAFAPGTGGSVSIGRSLTPSISSCSPLARTSLAARLGLSSAAAQIGEMRNRVESIQAKFMLSAGATGSPMQSWKRAATGECP